MKVGYVVKRYPRYSETFIVNEILAHEAAGLELEIFSLLPPEDGHFQDAISRVRAPVTYLPSKGLKVAEFWAALEEADETFPQGWTSLETALGEDDRSVYQALVLAREMRLRDISLCTRTSPPRPPRLRGSPPGSSGRLTASPPTPKTSSTRASGPKTCGASSPTRLPWSR